MKNEDKPKKSFVDIVYTLSTFIPPRTRTERHENTAASNEKVQTSISQTVPQCLSTRALGWRAHQTHGHLQLCSLDPSDRRTEGSLPFHTVQAEAPPPHTHGQQRKEQRQRSVCTNHLSWTDHSNENGLLKSIKLQEPHLFFNT